MAVLYLLLGQGAEKVLGTEASDLVAVLDPDRATSDPEYGDPSTVDSGEHTSPAGVRA
jgi:hypothetical protein